MTKEKKENWRTYSWGEGLKPCPTCQKGGFEETKPPTGYVYVVGKCPKCGKQAIGWRKPLDDTCEYCEELSPVCKGEGFGGEEVAEIARWPHPCSKCGSETVIVDKWGYVHCAGCDWPNSPGYVQCEYCGEVTGAAPVLLTYGDNKANMRQTKAFCKMTCLWNWMLAG